MIVITGATGYVGSYLVEHLSDIGPLLLVSRNAEAAHGQFSKQRICSYAELADQDLRGATFVHLAVRNNDLDGTIDEFRETNVDLLLQVAQIARRGGALRFVNLCTTHALDPASGDQYGQSKSEGARALAEMWPEAAVNLYVPAIYGTRLQGRLAFLNRVPATLRPLALALLRQFKPLISMDRLAAAIRIAITECQPCDDRWGTEQYCADPVAPYGMYAAAKRTIDLAVALAVIVLLGWAMILVAIYVRLSSKGPAIFAQQRVGIRGKVFTCYKFRTMALGTANAATHDVSVASVTSAGRFLRRTKIDELPQVINVIFNQMSLVGPRPCLPMQTELIERRRARGVLSIKPGITGLAQINDIDMSDPARLAAWDDRYGAFRSLLGDIVILARTVLGGGAGDRTASTAQ